MFLNLYYPLRTPLLLIEYLGAYALATRLQYLQIPHTSKLRRSKTGIKPLKAPNNRAECSNNKTCELQIK